jgi:hypothetical protein
MEREPGADTYRGRIRLAHKPAFERPLHPGMNGSLIFQIPVYRLSEDAFDKEQEALMAPYLDSYRRFRSESDARAHAAAAVQAFRWEFNDVVGWIELRGFHDMVKSYGRYETVSSTWAS